MQNKSRVHVWWNDTDVGIMEISEAIDYVKNNLPHLEKGEKIEVEIV